ncbi:MAG: tandem-95 repeat protein, partial [Opitutae bacterium]|nr:tandem-95 repeat protein [Opitutae bacterium]
GSTETKDLATTWQVLGSTEDDDAIDHTGTTGAGTGIHIYTPQGSGNYQLVATSYTDLWDSSILTGIHYGDGTEAGDGTDGDRAWTGTKADGTAVDGTGDPSAPLGGFLSGLNNVGTVRGGYIDSNWVEGPNASKNGQRSLMGISGLLPPPAAPVITQAGPLAVTILEDTNATWAAADLNATDADVGDFLTWSVSSAASNGTATVAGTAAAPSTFTYVPNGDFNGNDSFVVQVSDGDLNDTITVNVTVTAVNDAPVITSVATNSVSENQTHAIDVNATDGDGDALTYTISGGADQLKFDLNSSTGVLTFKVAPDYEANGSAAGNNAYVVEVNASDGTVADTQTITIVVLPANYSPVIKVDNIDVNSTSVTMVEDNASTFSLSGLTASDFNDPNATLVWSVDTNATNGTAVVEGTGTEPSTVTFTPNPDFNGIDSFVLKVTDAQGAVDTLTVYLTVTNVNDGPLINDGNATIALSVTEENATTLSAGLLVATDVDTIGSGLIWSVLSGPSNGAAVVSGTGNSPVTFTYTSAVDFNGTDSFVARVSDGLLDDNITVNVTVSNVNDRPVINDGNATVSLTVIEDTATSFTLTSLIAIDVDTASVLLVWNLDSNASHGVASVSGSGASPLTFSFLPDANFTGLDSFDVRVSDGVIDDLIRVDLNVTNVNDPPHFTSVPVAQANPLVPYLYTVTAADADGNATPLTLTAALKPNWPTTTFVDNGDGTGVLSGTPLEGHLGDHNVTLVVSDGNLSTSQSFIITVEDINAPPVITQGQELNATVMEDNASTWTETLAASDVDDDDATLVWTLDSNATYGVATVSGTGPSPTTFTYVPNLDYNGSDSFVVRVSDWKSSDLITVNIDVLWVDDPPVVTQGMHVNGTVAERREANATIAWLVQPDLNATDIDHNASFLTWSLLTPPTNGEAEVNGTGAAPTTFTYSPNVLFDGTDSFVVQVSDGNLTDTATVTVIVPGVNDPPVIVQGTSVTATMDEGGYPTPWQAPLLTATDPEGDLLTWSAYYVNASDGNGTLTVSGTGSSPSVFSYSPNLDFNGTDAFQVRVADGNADGNDTDEVTVTVTVTGNEEDTTAVYSLTAPVTYTMDRNASLHFLVTGGAHLASPSPRLTLFTDNVYVFDVNSTSGGPLFLGTSPGIPYVGGEVWGNGAIRDDEYIVFRPTSVTPPLLYYYDGNYSNNIFAPIEVRQYQSSDVFARDPLPDNAFGGAVSLLGDRAILGATGVSDGTGAVYVFDRDANGTLVQSSKVTPNDLNASSLFGGSVALGNDFLVAGASRDLAEAGSAYVYNLEANGSWMQSQKLLLTTPVTAIDAFGKAVAVSGDALVVTAIQPGLLGNEGNGSAYVFRLTNGNWTTDGNLTASDGASSDQFGSSVALDGNLTVVGANKADANGLDSGAAYVFNYDANGSWSQEQKLLPAVHTTGDEFGTSVAILGSVALVGSIKADGNGTDSGAAYVFRRDSSGNWTQEALLAPPVGGVAGFGSSVALSGNYALVDSRVSGTGGASYLYRNEENSTLWTFISMLGRTQGVALETQGNTVAMSGDMILAGSPGDDRNGSDAGSATLFTNPGWGDFTYPMLAPIVTQGTNLSVSMNEDGAWTVPELNASDPFGDILVWSLDSNASNGLASVSGTGNSPSTFSYVPEGNYSGTDTFVVQVSDGLMSDLITVDVNVTAQPDAPVFTSTSVVNAVEGSAYTYHVVATDDDDGAILVITAVGDLPAWMAGDGGGITNHGDGNATLSGFPTIGDGHETYPVSLRVTDDTNRSAEQNFLIVVAPINFHPVIRVDGVDANETTATVNEDDSSSFVMSSIISAIDDTLPFGDLTWSVDANETNGTVSVTGDGFTPTVKYTPFANFNGPDSFSMVVFDGEFNDTIDVYVTVESVNDPPIFTSSPAGTDVNEATTFTYPIQVADIDGDSIAIAATGLPSWLAFNDYGDGTAILSGTPAWSDYGTSSVFLIATDSTGRSTVQAFVVSVIPDNYPPVITQGVELSPIASMDEDGSPIVWTSNSLTATDSDSDVSRLVWTIKQEPANGTAVVEGMGASPSTFTYAPKEHFNGQDTFIVSVHDVDDSNASDEIIVPVIVNPQDDPPFFDTIAPAFGLKGNLYAYSVQASDPDGLLDLNVTGSFPGWLFLSDYGEGNATLHGTPSRADDNVTVTLKVKDPTGLIDTQTFSINVIGDNSPPVVAEGSAVNISMDEDGNPIAWQPPVLTATDIDGHPLHWSLSESPSHGIAEVNGTGSSPSTFSYVPDGNYSGTDSFVVQVTDSIAYVTVTVQVTIDPQSDAPVFVSTPNLLVEDGVKYTYELNATDADGDVDFTFFVPSSLPLPAWLNLVEENGKSILTGVPSVSDKGPNPVQVAVKDDSNLSTVQSFNLEVEVLNYPPSITVKGLLDQNSTTVTIDEDANESTWVALGLELNATDDLTNALDWSINSSPLNGNATIAGTGNSPDSLIYVPEANFNGSDQFTVRVTDQKGVSHSEKFDEITVFVTVRAVADAPSFSSTRTPITTITDELDYLYEVSTTDPDGNDTLTLSYNGTLPSWLTFSDEGNGTAILRGRAAVGDEVASSGNPYPISLVVDDGNVSVDQNFTITVSIENYPPVIANAPFSVTMSEDGNPTAWKIPLVTAVDPDPEVSGATQLTWSLGAQAAHGISEVNGTGATLGDGNDTFIYLPDENYFGTDSFIVRVSDGHRTADANVSVTVFPRPDPPAFVSVPPTYARSGQEYRYDISVVDPDGGNLSLRVFGLRKDWMNLDDSNSSIGKASIYGTPPDEMIGKFYPISLVAIDPTGRLAFQSFTLEVGPGNVPPVIAEGEQLYGSIYEDNPSSWSPPDLNASNSDGDMLVWNLVPGEGPSHGTATIEGNGSRPSTFDYVADANYSGTDSFVIQVWDGYDELNATVNVTVHPVNDAPELYGAPVTAAVEGKLYSFDFNATDIDGDALTFTFTESPSWLASQDLGQGLVRISGIPPIGSRGDSNVTFTAMDDGNATAEISFGLAVSDGLPPVISLIGDSIIQLPIGEDYIEPGYVGSDDSDGDITEEVNVSSAVNSNISGTYPIIYSLSDKAGNDAAPLTRVVYVSDPSVYPQALRATSASINAEIHNIALGSDDSVYSVGSFTDLLQFGQTTIHSNGLTDVFLSRLSPDGSPLWVTGFGGIDSDNGTDVVIGLDDSAYVTGSFRGAISFGEHSLISEGGSDAFLLKVDSQGSVLWAKTLGGPGDDNGLALSVSADGSVLWTGFHSSNSFADSTALEDFGGLDTFLAKVGVDGSYAWVRSVGRVGDDSGEGVAVDPSGGSYLVGNVSNQSPSDIFLLRYNDDGELVWARDAGGISSDTATSIVADSSGVYVTGNFEETATFEGLSITSAGLSDVYLAKYSPSGSLTWARSFGGVGTDDSDRIDLDPFGNPCLLGSFEGSMSFDGQVLVSKGSRDLFISKTSGASGKLIWSRSIGGETLDSAHGLSSGSEGSLYLASHYIGNSLTIDSLAVSTTGTHGFSILKLGAPHGLPTSSLPEIGTLVTGQSFGFDINSTSHSGILPRFQFVSGPSWLNLQDRGNGSALLAGIPPAGSAGSYNAKIRITDMQGGTVDKSLDFDVFKGLSEPTGFADEPETLWLQPGQGGEFANGVAESGDGGFFVVGAFTGSTEIGGVILSSEGRTDSFVAKFNSGGKLEWVNRFGGLGQDYAYAVDVDLNGVAYVAGYFTGTATFGSHDLNSTGGYDVYLLRIEPDNQITWAKSFGGNSEDFGKAVHAAPDGSVYLAGHFSDVAIFGNSFLNSNGGEDGFVAKINGSNGSLEWVKNMGGQNSDRALDLTEDGNNGVAVAGRFESVATFGNHSVTSLGFGDAFLANYDASGSCLFAVRAGGTGEDEGRAVVRSSTGSYLFGGNFRNSSTFGGHAIVSRGGSDAFLAWISPHGAFSSVTSLGGVWSDEVVDLALDVSGKPIVAGSFRGSVEFGSNTFSSRGDSDAFIAKLSDTNSSVMWVKTGGGVGPDAARAVAVDSLFDRICLAGYVSPVATFDNLVANPDTSRRSLFIADLGYPSADDTGFRS